MPEPNPVFILLSVFIPLGTVGVILGLAGIIAYTRQVIRRQELAAELVLQMLNRKMSADEIEQVLITWSNDPELAKKFASQRKYHSAAAA
ncbi:hypothetical protein ETAA8_31030 [Anatilimnocola aggregata]|uniref:Uncharacterized protein n=1 Tax=Anatilimnocola aggregata TaxID=2528021 RepID=A0A517YCQ7_9BACT|nr:hypothetical protein [Anatilimnocola aggregata]QDU28011.1 hypothetical protein ETAA8_31030 [Anatilimnocola aggregata]